MQTIPLSVRERILASCDAGHGTKQVASWFGVCEAIVRRLKQRRRETGDITPRQRGRRDPGTWTEANLARLRQLVEARPDATIPQLQVQLVACFTIHVSERTVGRGVKKAGFSFKKRRCGRASRIGRT